MTEDDPIVKSGGLITPLNRLDIGYISLSSNAANNYRILDEFYKFVDDKDLKILKISSKTGSFSIKSILRELVHQVEYKEEEEDVNSDKEEDEGFSEEVNDESSTYSLETLRNWHLKNPKIKLVIIFEDTDSIDPQILNIFLKQINVINDIPMKVIFGLTSSNISDWINKNIFNDLKMICNNHKFETKSNTDLCLTILEETIVNSKVLIDDSLVDIILSRFFNSNNSIDNLVNEIKVSLMIHFYSNSFSPLIENDLSVDDYEVLKKLPSFKLHVEEMFSKNQRGEVSKQQVEQCFTDAYIKQQFDQSKALYFSFKQNLEKIISMLGIEPIKAYQLIIKGSLFKSKIFKAILENQQDKESFISELQQLTQFPVVFKEIFFINGGNFERKLPKLVENYQNLMLNLVRPNARQIIENNLLSTQYLDNSIISQSSKFEPILIKLFNLLDEAPPAINHHDFFMAFKHSLNKEDIIEEFRLGEVDDIKWDKILLSWFLQVCNEFMIIGLIKEKSRGDHFEKSIWRGL
ncbi:origin recognition complex subunit 3 [[Candida] jaroonii]|uniref:Origin recognition complex subunit 3 n=1 Tax=[Candida] jaroonii TaxID=467808 RepID=A0ACA9YCA1_9ASCO|nr:origin recognition complex subunit 3 [[Candida] jaroonii]